MPNPVIHVEVLGKDAALLQSFYRNAFDWDFAGPSAHALGATDYAIAFPGPGEGGVPSGVGREMANVEGGLVTFYICVENIEETLRKITELGGKIRNEPAQAPGSVRVALFEDPEGHAIGLVQRDSL